MTEHRLEIKNKMDRRRFLGALAGGAAALAMSPLAFADEADKRNNVLFIAVDDLNDWIGCMGGHPDAKTPNIDRLAKRGVVFDHAYCSSPTCCPSRTSLFTGLRPSTTGIYRNDQYPWQAHVDKGAGEIITLPRYFRQNGYYTAGGGKLFHGGDPSDPKAWDEYQNAIWGPRPPKDKRPLNGLTGLGKWDWGPLDVPDEKLGDSRLVEWTVKQLEKDHRKPFFLASGIYRPHQPWHVPRKYFEMFPPEKVRLPKVFKDDLNDIPPAGLKRIKAGQHKLIVESGNWRKAVAAYLACIAFADACVGRILAALEKSPHAKNTTVVLFGDHGWHLGEKQRWSKFALWERATRTPLIISAPGMKANGTHSPRTASLLDLYPTLTDLCALPARKSLEGRSLKPLLKDAKAEWDRPVVTTYLPNNHSIRSERHRYIRYADGSEELYDHKADGHEWHNLAGKPEYAGTIKKLRAHLPKKNVKGTPWIPKSQRKK